jgi:superfamily II DNA or RNA helicase
MSSTNSLRPYQEDALTMMLAESGFQRSKKGNLKPINICLPCGTGKSVVIISYVISRFAQLPCYILVLVPSRLLLDQLSTSFEKKGIEPIRVGTGYNNVIADELKEMRGMTTPPQYNRKTKRGKLVIGVYNSAEMLDGIHFDTIIVDEAHHIYVQDDSDVEASGFKAKISGLDARKRINLSANLRDPTYSYPLRQAIKEGFLTNYDVLVPSYSSPITDSEVLSLLDKHKEWKKVLLYSNSIERAKDLSTMLNALGKNCGFITGTSSLSDRKATVETFATGSTQFLSTVNVLGEGIDIPVADTCFFVEPRRSKVAITQCVGRVLRLHPDKKLSHIISPIVSIEKELAIQKSKEEFNRIVGELSVASVAPKAVSSSTSSSIPSSASTSAPCKKFDERLFAGEDVDEPERQELEEVKGTTKTRVEHWEDMYDRVKRFEEKNKRPPKRTVESERSLANWLSSQNTQINNGKITKERENLLGKLPFFGVSSLDLKWEEKFGLLKKWSEENKRLPTSSEMIGDVAIGRFIITQRRSKKDGKLETYRTEKLASLVGWKW